MEGHAAPPYEIRVVEYDERWPADFERVAGASAPRSVTGSWRSTTSARRRSRGCPAKPVIDVDLVVADPADEPAYIPDLEAAGFVHTIREPWWHEHRLVKYDDPVAYVHIFGPDCPEVVRHRMFHDWLVEHDDDRERTPRPSAPRRPR